MLLLLHVLWMYWILICLVPSVVHLSSGYGYMAGLSEASTRCRLELHLFDYFN